MTGRSKSSGTPVGLVEVVDLDPVDLGYRHDRQLGDPVSPVELDPFLTVVDQQHADLSPVARIDEPGPVDHTYAMSPGMAGPGQHETGKARRDGHGDAGGHCGTFSRIEREFDSGVKIDSCVADMSSDRNGQFAVQTNKMNLHGV